eukprot:1330975-Rhodomonas_salina.1
MSVGEDEIGAHTIDIPLANGQFHNGSWDDALKRCEALLKEAERLLQEQRRAHGVELHSVAVRLDLDVKQQHLVDRPLPRPRDRLPRRRPQRVQDQPRLRDEVAAGLVRKHILLLLKQQPALLIRAPCGGAELEVLHLVLRARALPILHARVVVPQTERLRAEGPVPAQVHDRVLRPLLGQLVHPISVRALQKVVGTRETRQIACLRRLRLLYPALRRRAPPLGTQARELLQRRRLFHTPLAHAQVVVSRACAVPRRVARVLPRIVIAPRETPKRRFRAEVNSGARSLQVVERTAVLARVEALRLALDEAPRACKVSLVADLLVWDPALCGCAVVGQTDLQMHSFALSCEAAPLFHASVERARTFAPPRRVHGAADASVIRRYTEKLRDIACTVA